MIRKKFGDLTLPALGFGCMRLPVGGDGQIDRLAVSEMVAYAMAHGVNYFDTGYDYHGGMSERVIGEVLSAYPRESYLIADKFPGYSPANWRKVQFIFEEQCKRLGVDFFDFYLFHNLSELNADAYINPRFGIFDYLKRQKEEGRIRHLGVSVHGSYDVLKRFLDAYGEEIEFVQIQLNYIDYEFQHARDKLELLAERGIPAWVMEPLRGGRLVDLARPFDEQLAAAFPAMRAHEVAFRFIQSMPTVMLTLSGMSDFEQMRDNIAIFDEHRPLTLEQIDRLLSIASAITAVGTIPCTGCGYCTEHCPAALDIPKLIGYYNEHTFSGGGFIVPSAVSSMSRDKRPNACLGCRVCEGVCPQGIKVCDVLADLSNKLGLKS